MLVSTVGVCACPMGSNQVPFFCLFLLRPGQNGRPRVAGNALPHIYSLDPLPPSPSLCAAGIDERRQLLYMRMLKCVSALQNLDQQLPR